MSLPRKHDSKRHSDSLEGIPGIYRKLTDAEIVEDFIKAKEGEELFLHHGIKTAEQKETKDDTNTEKSKTVKTTVKPGSSARSATQKPAIPRRKQETKPAIPKRSATTQPVVPKRANKPKPDVPQRAPTTTKSTPALRFFNQKSKKENGNHKTNYDSHLKRSDDSRSSSSSSNSASSSSSSGLKKPRRNRGLIVEKSFVPVSNYYHQVNNKLPEKVIEEKAQIRRRVKPSKPKEQHLEQVKPECNDDVESSIENQIAYYGPVILVDSQEDLTNPNLGFGDPCEEQIVPSNETPVMTTFKPTNVTKDSERLGIDLKQRKTDTTENVPINNNSYLGETTYIEISNVSFTPEADFEEPTDECSLNISSPKKDLEWNLSTERSSTPKAEEHLELKDYDPILVELKTPPKIDDSIPGDRSLTPPPLPSTQPPSLRKGIPEDFNVEHTVKKLPLGTIMSHGTHDDEDEVFSMETKVEAPQQFRDNHFMHNGPDGITMPELKLINNTFESPDSPKFAPKSKKHKDRHSSVSSNNSESSSSSNDEDKKQKKKKSGLLKDENKKLNDTHPPETIAPSPPPRKPKHDKSEKSHLPVRISTDVKLPVIDRTRKNSSSSSSGSDKEIRVATNKDEKDPPTNVDLKLDLSQHDTDTKDTSGVKAGDHLDFFISTSDSTSVYSTPRGPCNKIRSVSSYSSSSEDEDKKPYKLFSSSTKSDRDKEAPIDERPIPPPNLVDASNDNGDNHTQPVNVTQELEKSISSTDSVSSDIVISYEMRPPENNTISGEKENATQLSEEKNKTTPNSPFTDKKDIGTQVSVDITLPNSTEPTKKEGMGVTSSPKNKSSGSNGKKTKHLSSATSSSSDTDSSDDKHGLKKSKGKRKAKRSDSSGGIRAKIGELFRRKDKKSKPAKEKKKSTTDEDTNVSKEESVAPRITPEQIYDQLIVKKAPVFEVSANLPETNRANGHVKLPETQTMNSGDHKVAVQTLPTTDMPNTDKDINIKTPARDQPKAFTHADINNPSLDLPTADVDIKSPSTESPTLNADLNLRIPTVALPENSVDATFQGPKIAVDIPHGSTDENFSLPEVNVIGNGTLQPSVVGECNAECPSSEISITSDTNKDPVQQEGDKDDKLNTSSSSSNYSCSSSDRDKTPIQTNSIVIEESSGQLGSPNNHPSMSGGVNSPLCISPSVAIQTPVKGDISASLNISTNLSETYPEHYTDGHHFVVVAIDFGTTFSGYAFSFVRDAENILMMRKWEGGDPGVINQKTPTIILLDPNGKFHSFGYAARDTYNDLDPKEAGSWLYFDKFKMVLHHQSELTKDTMLAASNGKMYPAINIFAYALKFLKDHALQELSDQSGFQIINDDIRWVITVPAIWKAPAKQFMRQAAYSAGLVSSDSPDKLLIALEPEAASIYCRKLKMHQLIPDYPIQRRLQSPKHAEVEDLDESPACVDDHIDKGPTDYSFPLQSSPNQTLDSSMRGTRYMVVDCGGGTVDITVHELSLAGKLIELHKATGGAHGAIGVDLEFEKLLGCIFGNEFITLYKQKYPVGWVNLMTNFEARKRSANPAKPTPSNVSLPFSFIDYHKKYKGKQVEAMVKKHGDNDVKWSTQGMLRLSPESMKLLFAPTLDKIKQAIGDVINHPHCRRLKYMFLVGGFAESPILQNEIRKEFDSNKNHIVKVLIPQAVSLAILKGAVMFGLDPTVVNVRRSRLTYGIGVLNRYDPEIHPESKLVTREGKDWCTDVFERFVCTDEAVALGDVVVKSYTPAISGQTKSIINMYCSENEHVQFITDLGVKKCGTLILDLDQEDIQDSAFRREIQIRMCFGDTEIKVSAKDITTGQVVGCSIDFLNK